MKLSRPLVLVGQLERRDRGEVLEFLSRLNFPIYAEGLSGLRGEQKLQHLTTVDWPARLKFESVLRIGGIPTCRVWRDLEEKLADLPVFNISERSGLPGLSRPCESSVGLKSLRELSVEADRMWIAELQAEAERLRLKLANTIAQFPESEISVFSNLARQLQGSDLYVGNSLPVREWDLVSIGIGLHDVYANRGANGIDGQLSTFLGWTAEAGPPAWAVVGDLTAMYDLTAPWILRQLAKRKRRLVVINNGGGMIFKKLFREESLLNRHSFGFSDWAKQWGLPYQTNLDHCEDESVVIELRPDEKQTDFFREAWETE